MKKEISIEYVRAILVKDVPEYDNESVALYDMEIHYENGNISYMPLGLSRIEAHNQMAERYGHAWPDDIRWDHSSRELKAILGDALHRHNKANSYRKKPYREARAALKQGKCPHCNESLDLLHWEVRDKPIFRNKE